MPAAATKLELTTDQAKLLTDIIDLWVLGIPEAKDATTTDPTIDSAEELLEVMASYDHQLADLVIIRKQLTDA